jgi:hypothetical protein
MSWLDGTNTATVFTQNEDACHRSYVLSSDAQLLDNLPTSPRLVMEKVGQPTTRTGHVLFDALHAMALVEVQENSVEQVSDGAFNEGQPVPCGTEGCFETGRKWNYVWTRDTAYAVDLGLAALEPLRSRNSLLFKTSSLRSGEMNQIVQDTGSGGSWPVSTDRVSWVLGAWAALTQLTGDDALQFRETMRVAIKNTVDYDRAHVFDSSTGLYRGEQSFLDWREQSYPAWTANDVSGIAMSLALSTNVLHLRALEVAAALSEDGTDSEKYAGWASELRDSINAKLWLDDDGLYSTFITTALDPVPARRFDLLGLSLAILHDVADATQAKRILQNYPHYGPGAPVIWPQLQDIPIYHNRGEWPFVTAYWLRAAAKLGNDAVAGRMMEALVRGAAINLSNMENFEAGTGANFFSEGPMSGPVVNSQRQLWSVAGYLSMVHHTLFGVHPKYDAGSQSQEVRLAPYLPRSIRRKWFPGASTLVLNDVPIANKSLTVVLHLPTDTEEQGGAYSVSTISINGKSIDGDTISVSDLPSAGRADVYLTIDGADLGDSIFLVSGDDYRNVFGPKAPDILSVGLENNAVRLSIAPPGDAPVDVTLSVFRDGKLVAADIPGSTTSWIDQTADITTKRGICYSLSAAFKQSGNCSQRSQPMCFWGPDYSLIQVRSAETFTAIGGDLVDNHGKLHYENWGQPGHALTASGFLSQHTGRHLVQVQYGNGSGPINTGITCAVKAVQVIQSDTGELVGTGMLAMPQLGEWSRWADSTFMSVNLVAGTIYDVVIQSDPALYNMSALKHFEVYTGGEGGESGPWNYVNISEVKLLPW